jgi:hypothetical protein
MTILKFEIDTDDIGYDEDGYGSSFESEFHAAIKGQITKRVINNITKEEIGQYSITVQEKVGEGVDTLFKNLLSEDVVITDGYGRKKFVGCVEDYIKKSIDERYLYPVDSAGKKLEGCTSNSNTWVQWYLEKATKEYVEKTIESEKRNIKYNISDVMEKQIKQFINDTVNDTVSDKLKNVGIRL